MSGRKGASAKVKIRRPNSPDAAARHRLFIALFGKGKPPPSEAEAQAAVRAFFERGGCVTLCPPAYAAAINGGEGR